MRYRLYLERREYLLKLIERGYSGNAEEIAHKIGVSRRTFFDYLSEFKEDGICIKFDYCEKRYKKIEVSA